MTESKPWRPKHIVVRQASVGKVAKSFHVQESEAKPTLCAAVLPKRGKTDPAEVKGAIADHEERIAALERKWARLGG